MESAQADLLEELRKSQKRQSADWAIPGLPYKITTGGNEWGQTAANNLTYTVSNTTPSQVYNAAALRQG